MSRESRNRAKKALWDTLVHEHKQSMDGSRGYYIPAKEYIVLRAVSAAFDESERTYSNELVPCRLLNALSKLCIAATSRDESSMDAIAEHAFDALFTTIEDAMMRGTVSISASGRDAYFGKLFLCGEVMMHLWPMKERQDEKRSVLYLAKAS